MRTRSVAEWLGNNIESSEVLEDKEYSLDLRSLLCGMFERAWLDLECSPHIKSDDRKSALNWFRGIKKEDTILSFEVFQTIIPMTKKRYKALNLRIRNAEKFKEELIEERKTA